MARTHFVDHLKTSYDAFKTRWKFEVMSYDVSAISERINIQSLVYTTKKLEFQFVLQAKQLRTDCWGQKSTTPSPHPSSTWGGGGSGTLLI